MAIVPLQERSLDPFSDHRFSQMIISIPIFILLAV